MVKIVIDRSLCSGFGACADLAPEIFTVDGEGLVSLRVGTSTDDAAAFDAASACPMAAISVFEEQAA